MGGLTVAITYWKPSPYNRTLVECKARINGILLQELFFKGEGDSEESESSEIGTWVFVHKTTPLVW